MKRSVGWLAMGVGTSAALKLPRDSLAPRLPETNGLAIRAIRADKRK
jgi:hypothetical protein